MYDGVVSRMHESAGALMSSYAHDLDTTNLSLTVTFLEGEKINSNVTNDIEVISSLSSDLTLSLLTQLFHFFTNWPGVLILADVGRRAKIALAVVDEGTVDKCPSTLL